MKLFQNYFCDIEHVGKYLWAWWAAVSRWNNFEIISRKFQLAEIKLLQTDVDEGWTNYISRVTTASRNIRPATYSISKQATGLVRWKRVDANGAEIKMSGILYIMCILCRFVGEKTAAFCAACSWTGSWERKSCIRNTAEDRSVFVPMDCCIFANAFIRKLCERGLFFRRITIATSTWESAFRTATAVAPNDLATVLPIWSTVSLLSFPFHAIPRQWE